MGRHSRVHGAPSMVPQSTFICHFWHNFFVSSHTDAIHIGAMEIDGSRMTLPR